MTSQTTLGTIEYRLLSTPDELEQVVDVELDVLGIEPRDAVPMSIMRAIALHGGMIHGAYAGERIVGMGLAFPARIDARWLLWSHMAGVHPAYQDRGIGFGIKQAQRTWALEHGYKEIRWTYDPLLRGNANFNLHRLGATASVYRPDYYGIMRDSINPKIPSDRVEATWKLIDRRVKRLAEGASPAPAVSDFPPDSFLLTVDARGLPSTVDAVSPAAPWAFAQIPRSTTGLDSETLTAWRLALRQALQTAFAAGYTAVDFVDAGDVGVYVLQAAARWYLYVLRCGDDSLYTGVSPDVDKRVARHNAGRGAAYTATRRPVRLLAAWQFAGRGSALKAELAFKRLSRAQKLARVETHEPFLGGAPVH